MTTTNTATGRLILLSTTHRTAPGLLSRAAWRELETADVVLAGDEDHPQLRPVREAGPEIGLLETADARALARTLLDTAAAQTVVWIAGVDGDPTLGPALAEEAARRNDTGGAPEIELLPGSWDLPGARVLDLIAVMDRLRSPGGCPWDAEQTHASLVKYLVEESYELVDAIESGDREHLREELGDVLLQVAFHSRVAEEHPDDPFTIDDVAGGIVDKMMNRHPHVFGDVHAPTSDHVEANWEEIKAKEKSGRESVVDGIAMGQPALSLAAKLISRTHRAGLDVPVPGEITAPESPEQIGDLLLTVVDFAGRNGVDAETALRAAAMRHRDRIRAAE